MNVGMVSSIDSFQTFLGISSLGPVSIDMVMAAFERSHGRADELSAQ